MSEMFNPSHPGRIIADVLPHLGSVEDFKTKLGINQRQLDMLTNGEMPISVELSEKITTYFGQPASDMWKRMSDAHYEWQAAHADEPKRHRRRGKNTSFLVSVPVCC